jgi:hypothetical protein
MPVSCYWLNSKLRNYLKTERRVTLHSNRRTFAVPGAYCAYRLGIAFAPILAAKAHRHSNSHPLPQEGTRAGAFHASVGVFMHQRDAHSSPRLSVVQFCCSIDGASSPSRKANSVYGAVATHNQICSFSLVSLFRAIDLLTACGAPCWRGNIPLYYNALAGTQRYPRAIEGGASPWRACPPFVMGCSP